MREDRDWEIVPIRWGPEEGHEGELLRVFLYEPFHAIIIAREATLREWFGAKKFNNLVRMGMVSKEDGHVEKGSKAGYSGA